MKEILNLARPEIVAMTPYSSARVEQKNGEIWLNANENPWDAEGLFNRYPDQQPQALLEKLSALYQVKKEKILVGRGSDEAIDLLVRVFCAAGKDAIMITPPTYGMYKVSAIIQNAAIVEVPLLKEQGFALDISAILTNWQPNIKLIFLCSPNNPTGNLLDKNSILYLCQQLKDKALIVVDEAYIDFANVESLISEIDHYSNLVLLRTLSKAHGLAGIRCGTVIASPVIIQLLKQVIAPYPVPRPVADLICQRLTSENIQEVNRQVKLLIQQRDLLIHFLSTLSYVEKIWPSKANYILFKVKNAKKILDYCLTKGVVIRDRSRDCGLENCIRITIGTPIENQQLMKVLKDAEA